MGTDAGPGAAAGLFSEARYSVLADGVGFPEGLAWSAEGGCVFVSGAADGRLYRVPIAAPRLDLVAAIGGGLNNCALAAGGGCVVTQNGGLSGRGIMADRYPHMRPPPEPTSATPGLILIEPDGAARAILDHGVDAPNDLAVGPDGALYFTDPGDRFLADPPEPRLKRYDGAGLSVVAAGFGYCNGIAFDDESILITDRVGLLRLGPDGGREWVIADAMDQTPDGIAVDVEGRIYVAGGHDGCVFVIEDGAIVASLVTPGGPSRITNCCFGGPDMTTLFVADPVSWALGAWRDMPTAGRLLPAWSPPD
jgi:gluconolactonase